MLTEFDDLWESIPLQERARLIELLIERVDYDGAAGKIKITFHPTGIASIGDASRRCAGHATACRKQRRIDFSDDLHMHVARHEQDWTLASILGYLGIGHLPVLDTFRTFFRSPPLDFRLQYQAFQEGFKAA